MQDSQNFWHCIFTFNRHRHSGIRVSVIDALDRHCPAMNIWAILGLNFCFVN